MAGGNRCGVHGGSCQRRGTMCVWADRIICLLLAGRAPADQKHLVGPMHQRAGSSGAGEARP